ncbi:MAG: four helix bundle protein [Rickettsiales bacterium]|jgi:four helix bundle protein|nr:four helix bundle protein [Rickettsiales bacterium]
MNSQDLKFRTKSFALRIIKLAEAMPKTVSGRAVANQIVRSGTSVAANYRAALRGRSRQEFLSKIGIVVEEVDETLFWLEIILEAKLIKEKQLQELYKEADELVSIFCSISKTTKNHKS